MNKRSSDEQIIGLLKEVEDGVAAKELCRRHGFSASSTPSTASSPPEAE